MLNILDLPDHVIVDIFSFLNLKDRKNARLVCSRWHCISYSLSLIKQDITMVENYLALDKIFSPASRHYNIEFSLGYGKKPALSSVRAVQFWSKFGKDVRFLKFSSTCHYSKVWSEIFAQCPNLEHLSLTIRDKLDEADLPLYIVVKFPKLISLELRGFPDLLVPILFSTSKNDCKLQKISLRCDSLHVKSVVEALFNLIVEQSRNIQEIYLSHFIRISDEFMKRMADALGPQFSRLYLEGSKKLTDRSLCYLAQRFPNLDQIILGGCRFSVESFSCAFGRLTQLTVVSIRHSSSITDYHVAALRDLSNLTRLDITECKHVTDEGICQVLGYDVRPKMIELRLLHLKNITDSLMFKIAPNLPNLRVLHVYYCPNITDISLEAIFGHNRLLRCLSITYCDDLGDLNVGPSVNALKNLIHLSLEGGNIRNMPPNCLNLPALEIADLSSMRLTQKKAFSIVAACNSLKYLICRKYPSVRRLHAEEEMLANRWKSSTVKCLNSPFGPCHLSFRLQCKELEFRICSNTCYKR